MMPFLDDDLFRCEWVLTGHRGQQAQLDGEAVRFVHTAGAAPLAAATSRPHGLWSAQAAATSLPPGKHPLGLADGSAREEICLNFRLLRHFFAIPTIFILQSAIS